MTADPAPSRPAGRELASAHVVVVGVGRLASAALRSLAGAGIGTLTVVDTGSPAAADAIARSAPAVRTIPVTEPFGPANALDLVLDADLLVDIGDDLATRYLANDIAAVRGIPFVWGSVAADTAEAGVAWDERGADYRDYRPEPPYEPPRTPAAAAPRTEAAVGRVLAGYVIALLTGAGDDLVGRVAQVDAAGRLREQTYTRQPGASRPGSIDERTAEKVPDASRSVTAPELAERLRGDDPPMLIDVREPHEHAYAALPGSTLIPLRDIIGGVDPLDRDADIVLYCHTGVRSGQALASLQTLGFTRAGHLTGGIDAWSREVDPTVPRY